MLKIQNLDKWEHLLPGKALAVRSVTGEPKKVRLEVNCETHTRFDVVYGEAPAETVRFLGVVPGGQDIIEVVMTDGRIMATSEGEVWFFSNEGDNFAVELPEEESFVGIMERQTRNPELERLMWVQQQNMERRFAQQREELEAMYAAMHADPDTGEVIDDGEDASRAAGGSENVGTDGKSGQDPAGDQSAGATSGVPAGSATGGDASGGAGKSDRQKVAPKS